MPETVETLKPELAAQLTDFARACKAALRAVSLYPGAHPAIGATLGRLAELTVTLTANGPFAMHVHPDTLYVGSAAPPKPDRSNGSAGAELEPSATRLATRIARIFTTPSYLIRSLLTISLD